MKQSSKHMTVRQEFYITTSGFIFMFVTVLHLLAYFSGWAITINGWMVPAEVSALLGIVGFVLSITALQIMR